MRWTSFSSLLTFFTLCYGYAEAANVAPRYQQSAVYDSKNDRIIIMGGTTAMYNSTKDVYALNLASAFDRASANFTTLPSLLSAVSDASAVVDSTGEVHLFGGQQEFCTNNLVVQVYNSNESAWQNATSSGASPSPRSGAQAVFNGDEILYFGGKSLSTCSSAQYYYNTLYKVDPISHNWTAVAAASPPVAEAGMTMTSVGDSSIVLTGGESVSTSAKASWVSMSQFAQFNTASDTWSYLSTANSAATIGPRAGHTAVYNGSHTFIYGGAIGSSASTPTFLILTDGGSSINITTPTTANSSLVPSDALVGHTAVLAKNGIMIILFGRVNSSTSSVYNDQIYLYDTVHNAWLESYDPHANPDRNETTKPRSTKKLSAGTIAAIVLVILLCTAAVLFTVISRLRKRRERARRLKSMPINRLGTFSPEDEQDFDHASITGSMEKSLGVHLPTWAAMHAMHAHTISQPPPKDRVLHVKEVTGYDGHNNENEFSVQDVQFACPPTLRDLTFSAPRLQLRIANPDDSLGRNSFETTAGVPELIETMQSGLTTTVPLTITNEDDLELLREKLSESPMIGNIDDQLAGLGLIIREDMVQDETTGQLQRVRTISRKQSVYDRAAPEKRQISNHGHIPELPKIPRQASTRISPMLTITTTLSPMLPQGFSNYSPELSSYSPFLDSPRSSHAGSPEIKGDSSPRRTQNENWYASTVSMLSKRQASWSSETTGLLGV